MGVAPSISQVFLLKITSTLWVGWMFLAAMLFFIWNLWNFLGSLKILNQTQPSLGPDVNARRVSWVPTNVTLAMEQRNELELAIASYSICHSLAYWLFQDLPFFEFFSLFGTPAMLSGRPLVNCPLAASLVGRVHSNYHVADPKETSPSPPNNV